MDAAGDDAPVFENAEWTVTAAGLEHKRTGYFIERALLTDRRADGLWTWPLHMAEKLWCAPALFADAFLRALSACAVEPDAALALSLAAAGGGPARPGTRPVSGGRPGAAEAPDAVPLGDLVRLRRAPRPTPAASLAAPRRAPAPLRTKSELTPRDCDEHRAPAQPRSRRLGAARAARG